MSFGLTNAPTTFINLMSNIFKKYMGFFILALIGDTLVLFKNNEEHKGHFEKVFKVLRKHKLYVNRSNYRFFAIKLDTLDMCCLTKAS